MWAVSPTAPGASSRWRYRSRRRGLLPAAGVSASVLTILLLAFPSSAATFRIEITPPYAGVTALVSSSTATLGCHVVARIAVPPFANDTSGRVGLSERSAASGCSRASYPQYAVSTGLLEFSGPNITVPVSGMYLVAFDWRFSFEVALSVSGNASNYARASILTYDFLLVPSNQSYLNVGSRVAFFHNIDSGSYRNETRNLVEVFEARLPLVAGVTYEFLTALLCGANVFLVGPGKGVAEFDFARHGDGGQLRAMYVVG